MTMPGPASRGGSLAASVVPLRRDSAWSDSGEALRRQLEAERAAIDARIEELETERSFLDSRRNALDVLLRPRPARRTPLGGEELRAAITHVLETHDPELQGMHYRDILRVLEAAGYRVAGADPSNNLRATIGAGKGLELYEPLGGGRFRLGVAREPAR